MSNAWSGCAFHRFECSARLFSFRTLVPCLIEFSLDQGLPDQNGGEGRLFISIAFAWDTPFGVFLSCQFYDGGRERFLLFIGKADNAYSKLRFWLSGLFLAQREKRKSFLAVLWRNDVLR